MTNQQTRDAEFCGKVPLHQTNLIQPHGVLLIVSKDDLKILQVSENISDVLAKPAAEVAETALSEYILPEEIALLQTRFATPVDGKLPLAFTFTQHGVLKKFLALVQQQPQYFIIEMEPATTEADSFIDVYQELKFVIASIEATTTVEEAAQLVTTELKRISGFDKVMIYRFDAEWNGSVIAEVMEPGMDAYLGLKFPASDIPKQAREMYHRNPYRLIPNVEYQPVRLYPVLNPQTGGFTDLTDSNLRSVAGVHLEYLRNMGVTASMSTRIVKDGVLWGLISCHHRTPKYLSYQMCSLFELLSDIISAKITALEQKETFDFQSGMQALYTKIVARVYSSDSIADALNGQNDAVLKLLGAQGAALVLNGHIQNFGETPNTTEIENLIFWLQANNVQQLYHTAQLPAAFEDAAQYAETASGLMALPVQPERGRYILAFRPEVVRQVSWGGNPGEAITFEPDGKRYHPRRSFSIWQEQVRQQALPWTEAEQEMAEQFRNFVVDYTLRKM